MQNNLSADTPENSFPKSAKDVDTDKHAAAMTVVFKKLLRNADGSLRRMTDTPTMLHEAVEQLIPLSVKFCEELSVKPWGAQHTEVYVGMLGQVCQALEQSLQASPADKLISVLEELAKAKGN